MNGPIERISHIVAIDGPAGAGKSSVARQAAGILGFDFLDTGAMYRSATWWALHQHVDLDDRESLSASTRAMDLLMLEANGSLKVLVGGHDVTEAIRTSEVTNAIRKLDTIPEVRECLVKLQREIGAKGPTVAEGRDMGTVVFPHAKCKIFLDASIEVRADRRARQLAGKGMEIDLKTLRTEIEERDESDRNREISPLRAAEDAYVLDTTSLSMDEVVEIVVNRARGLL